MKEFIAERSSGLTNAVTCKQVNGWGTGEAELTGSIMVRPRQVSLSDHADAMPKNSGEVRLTGVGSA